MHLSVARDEAALAAIWPEWTSLWADSDEALPFLSPAWLKPWWQVFGTGAPHVATLRCEGRLLGVLPLYRLGDKLLPLGVGISDYFDCLLAHDAPDAAARALLVAALDSAPVGRCDLPELPPGSALRQAAPPADWQGRLWGGPACPVLSLQPHAAIPKGMRRDIRQARHRAERSGGWRIERADGSSFPVLLQELERLHRLRWQARGEAGVLADADVQAFQRRAGPALIAAGIVRLEALSLQGQVASVIMALLGRRHIHFYISGFDPGFHYESPGTILLAEMIAQASAEGRDEAHFLRGNERYKYAWGGVDRFNAGRSLQRT